MKSFFNSDPKLGRIYFDSEDKIGRLDSSVAVGVALRPGEGEPQGGGARRAPARQVALGQQVCGQEEDVNVAHHGRQDPLFVHLSYLVGKELGKPLQPEIRTLMRSSHK